MKCIAGVGSRETPGHICNLMTLLGAWLAQQGVWIRSGHAPGADYAWELGAREKTIVYLPSRGFNRGARLMTPNVKLWEDVDPMVIHKALESIRQFHPAPERVFAPGNEYWVLLQGRNYFQMFGTQTTPKAVDAVVCWTPGGKGGGGTGQAVRLARGHNIPILDLGVATPLFPMNEEGAKEWLSNTLGL